MSKLLSSSKHKDTLETVGLVAGVLTVAALVVYGMYRLYLWLFTGVAKAVVAVAHDKEWSWPGVVLVLGLLWLVMHYTTRGSKE